MQQGQMELGRGGGRGGAWGEGEGRGEARWASRSSLAATKNVT